MLMLNDCTSTTVSPPLASSEGDRTPALRQGTSGSRCDSGGSLLHHRLVDSHPDLARPVSACRAEPNDRQPSRGERLVHQHVSFLAVSALMRCVVEFNHGPRTECLHIAEHEIDVLPYY